MNSPSLLTQIKRSSRMLALCGSALLLAACGSDDEIKHDTTVKLDHGGTIEGLWYNEEENGPREFLGIPYTEAPTGDLRFTPPQAASWEGSIDTQAFGPSCVQNPGALSAAGELSEDCLSLNVFTPALEEGEKDIPVMVWIHGGAFIAGGSNQYDAINLAKDKDVIVVTMNYRLGALGFFSHPDVDAELGEEQGNLGLQDQQLALKWVNENIEAFGGDKDNVTLFGESAGSMSVCTQMVAPGSQDYVDRFILQSGVCVGGLPIIQKSSVEAASTAMANDLCPDASDKIACLRSVTPEAVMAWGAGNGLFENPWGATVIANGPILPDTPKNLIEAEQYNKGGIIIGTNANEWGLFQIIGAAPSVTTVDGLSDYIDAEYPSVITGLIKNEYLPEDDAFANAALSRLTTDVAFRCPARRLASLTQATGTDTWLYSFEQGLAFHAYEIPYVFNYVSAPLGINPTESPTKDVMQDYWTSFAYTGNPNNDDQPDWSNYDSASDEHMVIKDEPIASSNLAKSACDMWDAIAAASAQ